MTVISQDSVATFEGNGIATEFSFNFRFFKDSDLKLTVTDPEGSSEPLTTGYTIWGAGNAEGGIVTLAAPLRPGYELRVERMLPVNQMTDLRNQGRFFAEVHEDTFDRIVMLIQQAFSGIFQAETDLRGTVRGPNRETMAAMPRALQRVGKLLSFDNSGNPVAIAPAFDSSTALRLDLANPEKGPAELARGVIAVDSIADLMALPPRMRRWDLRYLVKEYYVESGYGGGEFYWSDNRVNEFDGGTVLHGFVRVVDDRITPSMFGARSGVPSDDQAQAALNYCFSGDSLIHTWHVEPGFELALAGDLDIRRALIDCKGLVNLLGDRNMLIIGGRAQNADNATQYVRRVRRENLDETYPQIRIVGAKGQEITIGRCPFVQLWADTDDSNMDGSTAYSRFYLKYVRRIDLDTNPETSGSLSQWINENTFFLERSKIVNIRGTYQHNHNKFYGGSFENGAIINIESGSSNKFYGVRFEGSDNIVHFHDRTRDNLVEQTWSPNYNSNEAMSLGCTVINEGLPSNRVVREGDRDYTHQILASASPYDAVLNTSVGLPFETFGRRDCSLEFVRGTRTFSGVLTTGVVGCGRGDIFRVFIGPGSVALYRFRIRTYNARLEPVTPEVGPFGDLVSSTLSSETGGAASNSNSAGLNFELRSEDIKYVQILVLTGSNSQGQSARYMKVVRSTLGLRANTEMTDVRHTSMLNCVTGKPTQGYAPLGFEAIVPSTGERWLCAFSLDSRLSVPAGATDGSVIITDTGGATTPNISALSGILAGDVIGIQTDNPDVTHWTTVLGHSSGVVDLAAALPYACSAGRRVVIVRWLDSLTLASPNSDIQAGEGMNLDQEM